MADIRGKLGELYSLEQLSGGDTAVHRLHPLVKILTTLVYLVCVMSFDRYALGRLTPYLFYPVLLMALAEIPWGMIAKRALVALPFCLFAGLSNLFFDRAAAFTLGGVTVTAGFVSLLAILARTLLCVGAVLILVAVTPFSHLTGQLRRMHVPRFFVSLFEMVYRYIGALLDEAGAMVTAYRLRCPGARGPDMRHMGSFAGQLLLRSFDRAERVYQAMRCRGYGARDARLDRRGLRPGDWAFLLAGCGSSVVFRLVDLPGVLGGLF